MQYLNSFRQRYSQLIYHLFWLNTSDCMAYQTIMYRLTQILISVAMEKSQIALNIIQARACGT